FQPRHLASSLASTRWPEPLTTISRRGVRCRRPCRRFSMVWCEPCARGVIHAEPVPVSHLDRGPGGRDLWRHVHAGDLVRPQAARDHGVGPAGPVRQAALSAALPTPSRRRVERGTDAAATAPTPEAVVARKADQSDQALIELFLDMLA